MCLLHFYAGGNYEPREGQKVSTYLESSILYHVKANHSLHITNIIWRICKVKKKIINVFYLKKQLNAPNVAFLRPVIDFPKRLIVWSWTCNSDKKNKEMLNKSWVGAVLRSRSIVGKLNSLFTYFKNHLLNFGLSEVRATTRSNLGRPQVVQFCMGS